MRECHYCSNTTCFETDSPQGLRRVEVDKTNGQTSLNHYLIDSCPIRLAVSRHKQIQVEVMQLAEKGNNH
jgi:uncharacterized membrane protein